MVDAVSVKMLDRSIRVSDKLLEQRWTRRQASVSARLRRARRVDEHPVFWARLGVATEMYQATSALRFHAVLVFVLRPTPQKKHASVSCVDFSSAYLPISLPRIKAGFTGSPFTSNGLQC